MCQSINHIVSETLVFEDWRKKLKSIQQQNNKVPTSVAAFFLISFLNRSFDPSSRISRYKQTISYLLLNQTQKGPCPFISLLIRIVHHHHLLSSSIIVVIYLNQFCSLSFFFWNWFWIYLMYRMYFNYFLSLLHRLDFIFYTESYSGIVFVFLSLSVIFSLFLIRISNQSINPKS